jgi:hypothetical protein
MDFPLTEKERILSNIFYLITLLTVETLTFRAPPAFDKYKTTQRASHLIN